MMIAAALRNFLHGLIDYAGLFPPAALSMEESITNYRRYRAGEDAWMLSQFVLTAARVAEIPVQDGAPLALSVIPGGGATPAAFLERLDADLENIRRAIDAAGGALTVAAFEAKLPGTPGDAATLAKEARARLDRAGHSKATLFFEAPADERVGEVITALAESGVPNLGFKLRCGGLTADLFPSPARLATALYHCAKHVLPVKFTAGLHHPLRHHDPSVGTLAYGFVNVFAAAMLARSKGLDVEALAALLECQDPGQLAFTNEAMAFCGHILTADEIATLRREFALSYGSCSFDEPREDLHSLGLLPATVC
jgi:hypothetical protein